MKRETLLKRLAARIDALILAHPVREAVHGIDTAGKTTLAKEFMLWLRARGRPVIWASIDDFHRPWSVRYRRAATSAEGGYYRDSFDYSALRAALLLPLGPARSGYVRRAVFEFRADRPLAAPDEAAPPTPC
jgi:uridine kinase